MTTILYSHPACSEHDPGPGHPENPGRLKSVLSMLAGDDFSDLLRREPPDGRTEDIARIHPLPFVEAVLEAIPTAGYAGIDMDTIVSPGSGQAALCAVGSLVDAVDQVFAGEANNAFCAVRPPGHHAEPNRAMGFCLFNSVAVAAEHARAVQGAGRVAVIDFDVHHGNGTQAAFWDDADLFYASTHQMPLYPGTGSKGEIGVGGNIVNCPLPPGAGSEHFREAMRERLLPSLRDFSPDLVIISAGFDAHADDPLAQLNFREDDYAWATEELLSVAADCCEGRLVSALEGGYDYGALARSCGVHVKALMSV